MMNPKQFNSITFLLTFSLCLCTSTGYRFSALFDRFAKKIQSLNELPMEIKGGHISSTSSQSSQTKLKGPMIPDESLLNFKNVPVNLLFCDVDGTLVHYPKEKISAEGIIHLPPSSTGMQGIISSKTLKLCQMLRQQHNTKIILVSGMRTSTLLKRLPYLPKADAYASEAGGRIFFPVSDLRNYDGTIIEPIRFTEASDEDISPFGLVEDLEWREEMSKDSAAGSDGYLGDAFDIFQNGVESQGLNIDTRKGSLWNFAKSLEEEGFTLDTKGYSCCFRVNIKQQSGISEEKFLSLSKRDVAEFGLASSVNLGCIDFYPKMSGKKNCCLYLAKKFMRSNDSEYKDLIPDDVLLQQAICLCDDDNDLEMAFACGTVFLPSVTSQSMAEAAEQNPDKIFITEEEGGTIAIVGTSSTEEALLRASKLIQARGRLSP